MAKAGSCIAPKTLKTLLISTWFPETKCMTTGEGAHVLKVNRPNILPRLTSKWNLIGAGAGAKCNQFPPFIYGKPGGSAPRMVFAPLHASESRRAKNLHSNARFRAPFVSGGSRLLHIDQPVNAGGRFNLPHFSLHISPTLNSVVTDRRRPDRVHCSVIGRRSDFECNCACSSRRAANIRVSGAKRGVISETKAGAGSNPASRTKYMRRTEV